MIKTILNPHPVSSKETAAYLAFAHQTNPCFYLTFETRSCQPIRNNPAAARMSASYFPNSSSFLNLVLRFPLMFSTLRLGYFLASWAVLLKLEVPIVLPAGRVSRDMSRQSCRNTRASLGSSL